MISMFSTGTSNYRYTPCSNKKGATKLMAVTKVTSSNLNRFSKSLEKEGNFQQNLCVISTTP